MIHELNSLAIGGPGGGPMLGFLTGPWDWVIIGAIALLLFGKRLPEVGKSLGQGIVEFKKGLKGEEEPNQKEMLPPPEKK